MKPRWSCRCTR